MWPAKNEKYLQEDMFIEHKTDYDPNNIACLQQQLKILLSCNELLF
jgi:hypothetical protein